MPRGGNRTDPGEAAPVPAILNCPACGAPLAAAPGQTLAICSYCSASVRLDAPGSSQRSLEATTLSPEALATLRGLILEGKRDDAIRLYMSGTGVNADEAVMAVDMLIRQYTRRAMTGLPISNRGILLFLLLLGIGTGGIWLCSRAGLPGLAVLPGLFLLLELLVTLPMILTRIRLARGVTAAATLEQLAQIRTVKAGFGKEPLPVMRLLLTVRPPEGAPFRHELNLPVSSATRAALQPGTTFAVRGNMRTRRILPVIPIRPVRMP